MVNGQRLFSIAHSSGLPHLLVNRITSFSFISINNHLANYQRSSTGNKQASLFVWFTYNVRNFRIAFCVDFKTVDLVFFDGVGTLC